MLLIMTKSIDRAVAAQTSPKSWTSDLPSSEGDSWVWHPISSGSKPRDLSYVDFTQPGLHAFTDSWFGWTHTPANRPEAAEVMPCC